MPYVHASVNADSPNVPPDATYRDSPRGAAWLFRYIARDFSIAICANAHAAVQLSRRAISSGARSAFHETLDLSPASDRIHGVPRDASHGTLGPLHAVCRYCLRNIFDSLHFVPHDVFCDPRARARDTFQDLPHGALLLACDHAGAYIRSATTVRVAASPLLRACTFADSL